MLKRLRAAHPILYCILAEVLFLGSLFLSSLVLTVALVAAGADFSGLDAVSYTHLTLPTNSLV